jgi:hypothetical protein
MGESSDSKQSDIRPPRVQLKGAQAGTEVATSLMGVLTLAQSCTE